MLKKLLAMIAMVGMLGGCVGAVGVQTTGDGDDEDTGFYETQPECCYIVINGGWVHDYHRWHHHHYRGNFPTYYRRDFVPEQHRAPRHPTPTYVPRNPGLGRTNPGRPAQQSPRLPVIKDEGVVRPRPQVPQKQPVPQVQQAPRLPVIKNEGIVKPRPQPPVNVPRPVQPQPQRQPVPQQQCGRPGLPNCPR